MQKKDAPSNDLCKYICNPRTNIKNRNAKLLYFFHRWKKNNGIRPHKVRLILVIDVINDKVLPMAVKKRWRKRAARKVIIYILRCLSFL